MARRGARAARDTQAHHFACRAVDGAEDGAVGAIAERLDHLVPVHRPGWPARPLRCVRQAGPVATAAAFRFFDSFSRAQCVWRAAVNETLNENETVHAMQPTLALLLLLLLGALPGASSAPGPRVAPGAGAVTAAEAAALAEARAARLRCVVVIDRHNHKTGGSTMRGIFNHLQASGKCLYWGYGPQPPYWEAAVRALEETIARGGSRQELLRLCVELHFPVEYWENSLPRLTALRDRAATAGSCRVVLVTRVRDPLAFYLSYWRWTIMGKQVRLRLRWPADAGATAPHAHPLRTAPTARHAVRRPRLASPRADLRARVHRRARRRPRGARRRARAAATRRQVRRDAVAQAARRPLRLHVYRVGPADPKPAGEARALGGCSSSYGPLTCAAGALRSRLPSRHRPPVAPPPARERFVLRRGAGQDRAPARRT